MKNQNLRIDHINLTVKNLDTTITWYKKIFGFEEVEAGKDGDTRWSIIRNGDIMLAMNEYPQKAPIDQSKDHDTYLRMYHFGLRLNDIEEWEEILNREKLPTFYSSPLRYKNSTSWYVKDPNGHMIEVVAWDNDEVKFR